MALKIRSFFSVFIAACSILFLANQSTALGAEPPVLGKCDSSPLGSQVRPDEIKRYSGYYRLDDRTFWHIMPGSRHLYVLVNDSSVTPLWRAAGGGFCFGKSSVENFFFSSGAEGISNTARLHVDASENFVMDEKGLRTQVDPVPAHDIIAPRVEREVALSIYAKIQLIRRSLEQSRAPHQNNLSQDMDNKIKTYIFDKIEDNDKFDPYSLSQGSVISIEYLGISPQGEHVLRVERERFVGYWRIFFGQNGQIERWSISGSL